MIGWSAVLIKTWIALAPVLAASLPTSKWELKADDIDACSCDLACPCLNHTQYKTVALIHDNEKEGFSFSGTNGYTARIDASSDPTE